MSIFRHEHSVANAFFEKRPCPAGNEGWERHLSTDGKTIVSYGNTIAKRGGAGEILVLDERYVLQTADRHHVEWVSRQLEFLGRRHEVYVVPVEFIDEPDAATIKRHIGCVTGRIKTMKRNRAQFLEKAEALIGATQTEELRLQSLENMLKEVKV